MLGPKHSITAALQWSQSASHIVGTIPLLHSYIL